MATNSIPSFSTVWRKLCPAAILMGSLALSASPSIQAAALDQIAVVVNSEVILYSEVQQRVQMLRASKAGRGLGQAELLRTAVDELVTERLQAQYAKENGINVDDAMVDRAMASIARQNRMDMPAFQAALQKEGISMQALREQTRRKITADLLRKQQAGGKVAVSDREVNDLIASQSQKITAGEHYHLQHLLVAAPNGATIEQVNAARTKAEELRTRIAKGEDFAAVAKQFSDNNAAEQGGDLGWQTADALPSSFVRALALMQVGDISSVVRDQNGFHVLKLLEREGGKRSSAAESRVRHILISTQKNSPAEAKQKIDALYAQLQAGGNFAELAKAHSDDPGSAVRGGDLGWAKAGQMVAPFEQTMNSQALNIVSQPFQTQFGWHILEVVERKQTDQSADQIREKATSYLGGRKEEEQYQAWLQSLRNGAYIDYRLQGAAPQLQLK